MSTDIAQLAQALDQARATATTIAQLDEGLSIEDAYAVQRAILDLQRSRGAVYAGLKLGFTSQAKMEQMGVSDIIVGFLTREMELTPGAELVLDGLIHPRIEPELVFRLSRTVEPEAGETASDLAARIREATDAVAAGMEVIDSRYENFRFSLSDVVADNTSAARFVVGAWQDFPRPLSGLGVELEVDGEIVERGVSDAILGDPLRAFEQLASMVLRYGFAIPAGGTVLAGSMTQAVYLTPGQRVVTRVESFPNLTLDVAGGDGA